VNSNRTQSFVIYFLLIVAIGAMLYVGFRQDTGGQQSLTINEVADAIEKGTVARVVIQGDDTIHIVYKSGKEADSHKESTATLVDQLISLGVKPEQLGPQNIMIEVKPPSQWAGILSSLLYILPVVFMAGVLWFIFRQAQGSNNAAMAFGKSRARMFSGEHPTVTFDDVAGVEEPKQELADSKGRAAGGTSRNRQDSSGKGGFGRGGRSVLLNLGIGICGDVRGRRRQPGT